MTKRILTVNAEELSPYEFEGSLKNLRDYVENLISRHGEDAYVDWDKYHHYDYDPEPSPQYVVQVKREETDVEYNKRTAEERKADEVQRQRDVAELSRLKAKLGEK